GIYSSGLTLLSLGVRIPRPAAAAVDGVILTIGTIGVVFFAESFIGPFQSFLITLGVPMASWAGILIADIISRRTVYDEAALFDSRGRYGRIDWVSIGTMIVASAIGWGLVVNGFAEAAPWNNWQGYLLGLVGGKDGAWASANLGVLVALLLSFLVTLALRKGRIRRQEQGLPAPKRGPGPATGHSFAPAHFQAPNATLRTGESFQNVRRVAFGDGAGWRRRQGRLATGGGGLPATGGGRPATSV